MLKGAQRAGKLNLVGLGGRPPLCGFDLSPGGKYRKSGMVWVSSWSVLKNDFLCHQAQGMAAYSTSARGPWARTRGRESRM